MIAALTSGVNRLDRWLTSYKILYLIVFVVVVSFLISAVISLLNIEFYWKNYSLCLQPSCFSEVKNVFSVQIETVKLGVAIASFLALIFGSYLALRSYLTTSEVSAFGNRIAHIGFFERFISFELSRRRKINSSAVDTFSVYRLMFPASHSNSSFASEKFLDSVGDVFAVVVNSSRLYESRDGSFKFDGHRKEFMAALHSLHIQMDNLPRIDFLEVEDEVLEFLQMLCRVFGPPGSKIIVPERKYR